MYFPDLCFVEVLISIGDSSYGILSWKAVWYLQIIIIIIIIFYIFFSSWTFHILYNYSLVNTFGHWSTTFSKFFTVSKQQFYVERTVNGFLLVSHKMQSVTAAAKMNESLLSQRPRPKRTRICSTSLYLAEYSMIAVLKGFCRFIGFHTVQYL